MAHGDNVAAHAIRASDATGVRRGGWQEPVRTRRSKGMPAHDQSFSIAIAETADRATELRDLTSFVNRVMGWSTSAAAASGAA